MCSADGKIRLATLELSCLLLKQQVVTSTGCIIKDVHLACLEVRARLRPVPGPPGEREEVGEDGSRLRPGPWSWAPRPCHRLPTWSTELPSALMSLRSPPS